MKYSRKSYAIIRATDSICLRRNFVIYDADYSPDVEFLSSDPKPTLGSTRPYRQLINFFHHPSSQSTVEQGVSMLRQIASPVAAKRKLSVPLSTICDKGTWVPVSLDTCISGMSNPLSCRSDDAA